MFNWKQATGIIAVLGKVAITAASLNGQISVPEVSPPYTLIEVVAAKPEGLSDDATVQYLWEFSDGIVTNAEGAGKLIATGPPGDHVANLQRTCIDWETKHWEVKHFSKVFRIGVAPPTPTPVPDPNSEPEPQPDEDTLCKLVTAGQAVRLAAVYRAQATIIEGGGGETTGQFRTAHDSQIVKEGLEGHGAIDVVAARLNIILGSGDVELSDELRATLAACLHGLSVDFECDPPEPEQGKRVVLVVRETTDTSPERGLLYTALRDGTAADYLANNEHRLLILDDDSLDETGAPASVLAEVQESFDSTGLPALLILEADSRAILYAAKLEDGTTADNVIEILRQNGG